MKSIKSYEGRYSVALDGKIYSHRSHRFLRGRPLPSGYLRVNLVSQDGRAKDHLIHRLVAQEFIPNPLSLPEVNHKDSNKKNNRADNLEWCDKFQNMAHASRNGRLGRQSRRMSQMNIERCSVPVVGISLKTGKEKHYSSMSEAEKDGFSHAKISLCISGKRRTHLGFSWRKA